MEFPIKLDNVKSFWAGPILFVFSGFYFNDIMITVLGLLFAVFTWVIEIHIAVHKLN